MKSRYLILPCLYMAMILLVIPSCFNDQPTVIFPDQISIEEPEIEREDDEESDKLTTIQERLNQEFELTKDPATNTVPRQELIKAYEYAQELRKQKAALGLTWEERGPNNVGGRTRAILIDASDNTNNTVFAGGVSGGLWKTTNFLNASPTWTKVNDFFDNLAVTAIVQDPTTTSTMYFGTGEGWFNADAVQGFGIWKSTDSGSTWNQLSSTTGSSYNYVQDLLFDSNGNLYAGTRSGLFKSTNDGTTFSSVLGSSVADLELAADNDIYAAVGFTGSTSGAVWKSDNATHGANTGNSGNWTDITPSGSFDRIEIACAPSDGNRVYILCQGGGSNNCDNIYSSENGGSSWTARTVPTIIDQGDNSNFTRNQAWYDLIAAVDPNDADKLYIAGVDMLRSADKGATWEQITTWSLFGASGYGAAQNVHADHHQLIFLPGSSTSAIAGTDGGLYFCGDLNTSSPSYPSWAAKNTGYNVTQFYACALNPASGSNQFMGGTQDNGTQQFGSAGMNSTTQVTGGDGGFCHIDQDQSQYQFTAFTNLNLNRSTNTGSSFSFTISNNNGSFINPSDYDDSANIFYAGHSGGNYFRWDNPQTGTTTSTVSVSGFSSSSITHVATSPNLSNVVYFGLSNGSVVKVTDAHSGTSKSGSVIMSEVTNASVSCVAIEVGNEDHMLVTYSNYGVTSVWESTNATNATPTWTAVEGNIPNMPVRWALFNPNNSDQAIVATELGVWGTDNLNGGSTNWGSDNSGLANVRVDMLQTRSSDDLIIAGTHGRGIFSSETLAGFYVNFSSASSSQEEAATTGTTQTCKDYVSISIPVSITREPTSTVTVSITPSGASTAINGVDYILNTSSINFTNGGSTTQNVEVWVVDDAAIDGSKTLELDLAITNAGPGAQLGATTRHTLTITDNDIDPTTSSATTVTIGSGTSNVTVPPFSGDVEDNRTEYLYTASELTSAGLSAGSISKIAFNVSIKNSSQPYTDFTVAMKNGPTSELNFAWESGTTQVYNSNYTTSTGWNELTLSPSFAWDGSSGLVVSTCFNNSSTTNWDAIVSTQTGFSPRLIIYREENGSDGCSISSPQFVTNYRPNVQLTVGVDVIVESTLNKTKSAYLANGQTLHLYSDTGNILASITQTSGSDIGCVSVTLDGVGTGTQTPVGLGFAVTQKTFLITGANNANYDVTLYYQDADLTTFGANKLTLNMIKSTGAISSATQANSEVVPNANLTVNTFGTANNITYKGSFTSFSGFALTAEAALPVELTDFSGCPKNDNVELIWRTENEINNDYFILERSNDGKDFEEIAMIDGAGNSFEAIDYQYLDRQAQKGDNYYRLRQVDFSGKETLSEVIVVYFDSKLSLEIFPNPLVQDILNVKFEQEYASKVVIEVINNRGNSVFQNEEYVGEGLHLKKLDLEGLPKGIYYIKVSRGKNVESKRFLKVNR